MLVQRKHSSYSGTMAVVEAASTTYHVSYVFLWCPSMFI